MWSCGRYSIHLSNNKRCEDIILITLNYLSHTCPKGWYLCLSRGHLKTKSFLSIYFHYFDKTERRIYVIASTNRQIRILLTYKLVDIKSQPNKFVVYFAHHDCCRFCGFCSLGKLLAAKNSKSKTFQLL